MLNQQEKALQYLQKTLDQKQWKPGDRLPCLKKLGADAGVSARSMGRAVHCLCAKGILSVLPSSGIWVPGPKGEEEQLSIRHVEKWKKVESNIAQDLFCRALDVLQPLPSIQELRHRYGASYPVLKKALFSLEDQGILTSFKKTYKPNLFLRSGHITKILVLLPIEPDRINPAAIDFKEKGFDISPRGVSFLKELENIKFSQNLTFDIWGYYYKNNSAVYIGPDLTICSLQEKIESYYGICMIKSTQFTPVFSSTHFQFSEHSIPMAILDEDGSMSKSLVRGKNKNIRFFPIALSDLAGQKIGKFLLELGHREIAYISPWYKEEWTINRHLGLSKAFALAQGSANVHLFVDNRYPAPVIQLENLKLDESISQLPSIQKIISTHTFLSEEQANVIAFEVGRTFNLAIINQRIGIFLQPLFEQALANPAITAWVCADDVMAVLALRFLRKKGVAIPQKISVVGFEDIPEAHSSGLTTFNYDVRGITQNMVAYISNPMLFSEEKGHSIEKNGFLVIRGSTGPVQNG